MIVRSSNLFLVALLSFFAYSCSSDLDFNQANDLKIKPVIITNLGSFEIDSKDFAGSGIQQTSFSEETTIELFNDSFFRRRLKKVELYFELSNTINRAYVVGLSFLNKNDVIVYSQSLSIPAYTFGENKIPITDIIVGSSLEQLKETTKIIFDLNQSPQSTSISVNQGTLKMKSGLTAYLVVE